MCVCIKACFKDPQTPPPQGGWVCCSKVVAKWVGQGVLLTPPPLGFAYQRRSEILSFLRAFWPRPSGNFGLVFK